MIRVKTKDGGLLELSDDRKPEILRRLISSFQSMQDAYEIHQTRKAIGNYHRPIFGQK